MDAATRTLRPGTLCGMGESKNAGIDFFGIKSLLFPLEFTNRTRHRSTMLRPSSHLASTLTLADCNMCLSRNPISNIFQRMTIPFTCPAVRWCLPRLCHWKTRQRMPMRLSRQQVLCLRLRCGHRLPSAVLFIAASGQTMPPPYSGETVLQASKV